VLYRFVSLGFIIGAGWLTWLLLHRKARPGGKSTVAPVLVGEQVEDASRCAFRPIETTGTVRPELSNKAQVTVSQSGVNRWRQAVAGP
jgi:hypothetical protein